MQSPSRAISSVAAIISSNSETPSVLSFAVDSKRGKVRENRIVDAHVLRLLYNQQLQWWFVNARTESSLSAQWHKAELRDLEEASKRHGTFIKVIDFDVDNDTMRSPGSLSRNLRRVRQGLDLIRVLFANFISPEYDSLKEAASTAYAQVCAPYHT